MEYEPQRGRYYRQGKESTFRLRSGKADCSLHLKKTQNYVALTLLIALLSALLGQIAFGGYDGSALIDLGWRLQQGQVAYRDFPSLLPPIFLWQAAAAMRIFGVHWWAFTVFSSLTFVLLAAAGWLALFAAARYISLAPELAYLFLFSIAIPQLATSHVWHSAFASQCAVVVLLINFLLFRVQKQTLVWSRELVLLNVAFTSLVLTTKPNIAAVVVLSTVLFALSAGDRLRALGMWLGCTAGGAVIAGAATWWSGLSPLQVLHSYTQISERPSPLDLLANFASLTQDWIIQIEAPIVYAVTVLLLAGILLHLFRATKPRYTPALAAALSGWLISVAGFCTNWDIRLNDLPAGFFGVSLLLFSAGESRAVRRIRTAAIMCTFLAVLIVAFGRGRMRGVGAWARPQYGAVILRKDPFFGWFAGREQMWQIEDTISREIARHPEETFFFGPRLEFAYAAHRLPSPRGLPIWWHPGSSYATSDDAHLQQSWRAHRFDRVILLPFGPEGTIRLPAWLRESVARDYIATSSHDEPVQVYVRK